MDFTLEKFEDDCVLKSHSDKARDLSVALTNQMADAVFPNNNAPALVEQLEALGYVVVDRRLTVIPGGKA